MRMSIERRDARPLRRKDTPQIRGRPQVRQGTTGADRG